MLLPKPPTDGELWIYEKANRLYVILFNGISCTMLTLGMVYFYSSHPEFIWLAPITIITTLYFFMSLLVGVIGSGFDPNRHCEILWDFDELIKSPFSRASVDIFYPICGEEEEVCLNALYHIQDLAKYYGPRAQVYILDDSKNGLGHTLYAKTQHRMENDNYHVVSRPNKGEMKKAGNLRYAFEKTAAEFIVIFDADFCPAKNFLNHTLCWMNYDKNIAILQTPQFFSLEDHSNWIGKGAAYVQEFFYRFVQPHRDTFGGAICVGTNAVYRRSALEPFGGTAYVPHSEDVRTGVQCLAAGYKIKYIPMVLAKGLCPEGLGAFISQQHRWSLGSLSLFASREEFWSVRMSIMQRVCYLTGVLYYISTGLSIWFQFVPAILLLGFYPEAIDWRAMIFYLPSLLFGTLGFAMWTKARWGFYFTKSRMVSSYAHFIAVWEFFTKSLTPWQPTGIAKRNRIVEKFESIFLWTFYMQLFVLMGVAYRMGESGEWGNYLPMLGVVIFDLVVKIGIVVQADT